MQTPSRLTRKVKHWLYYEMIYQYEKKRDNFNLWVVSKLPRRLVMWCYIRVAGLDGKAPCGCFKDRLERWGVK